MVVSALVLLRNGLSSVDTSHGELVVVSMTREMIAEVVDCVLWCHFIEGDSVLPFLNAIVQNFDAHRWSVVPRHGSFIETSINFDLINANSGLQLERDPL